MGMAEGAEIPCEVRTGHLTQQVRHPCFTLQSLHLTPSSAPALASCHPDAGWQHMMAQAVGFMPALGETPTEFLAPSFGLSLLLVTVGIWALNWGQEFYLYCFLSPLPQTKMLKMSCKILVFAHNCKHNKATPMDILNG